MDMRAAADWAPELGDGEYERSCTVDGDAGREEEVGYTEDPNDASRVSAEIRGLLVRGLPTAGKRDGDSRYGDRTPGR